MIFVIGIAAFLILASLSGFANAIPGSGGGSGLGPLPPILGGGMTLTLQQVAYYARSAGFSGADLATAIAVAMAESGGNTRAYNPETAANTPEGHGSYGLWQIYLKAHPEFAGQDLYDPQINANAAFSVYRAAGYQFRPWSAFKNNTYMAFLDDATRSA